MDASGLSSNPAFTGENEDKDNILPFDDAARSGEPTYSQLCDMVMSMCAEDLGRSHETTESAVEQSAMEYHEHPVSKLNEHCMSRRLEVPRYKYARSIDDVIGPGWTARCTVVSGSDTVARDGFGTSKKEAKKIAAKCVYDVIAGRQDHHSVANQNSTTGEPVHLVEQSSSDVPCTAATMDVDSSTGSNSPSRPMEITSSSPPVYLTQNRRAEIVNEITDSILYMSCSTNETTSATVPGLKRQIADSDPDFPKPLTKKQKKNKKVNAKRKLKRKMFRANFEFLNDV